jgi:hypothetical protein
MLRFSRHARVRMQERRISRLEVMEAMMSGVAETPGQTARETNLWGSTRSGRRLRITVRSDDTQFVITVVALGREVE